MIYPLTMVIFHSFLLVYQRVTAACFVSPSRFFSDFRSNGSKLDHVELDQFASARQPQCRLDFVGSDLPGRGVHRPCPRRHMCHGPEWNYTPLLEDGNQSISIRFIY